MKQFIQWFVLLAALLAYGYVVIVHINEGTPVEYIRVEFSEDDQNNPVDTGFRCQGCSWCGYTQCSP